MFEDARKYFTTTTPEEQPTNSNAAIAAMIDHARKTPIKTIDINDDKEALALLSCAMRRGEKLSQFYARTGLSKEQARTMTQSQILSFCLQADKNNAEDPAGPTEPWSPKAPPQHFTI
jgi:hypothetical protein